MSPPFLPLDPSAGTGVKTLSPGPDSRTWPLRSVASSSTPPPAIAPDAGGGHVATTNFGVPVSVGGSHPPQVGGAAIPRRTVDNCRIGLHDSQLSSRDSSGATPIPRRDGRDPGSKQDAGRRLGVDRTTRVELLDALEQKGLVARPGWPRSPWRPGRGRSEPPTAGRSGWRSAGTAVALVIRTGDVHLAQGDLGPGSRGALDRPDPEFAADACGESQRWHRRRRC